MQRRRLKPDAVPSQFSWTKQPTSADVSRTKRYTECCVKREGTCEGSDELSMDVDVNCDLDIAMEVNVNSENNQAIQTDLQETLSTSTLSPHMHRRNLRRRYRDLLFMTSRMTPKEYTTTQGFKTISTLWMYLLHLDHVLLS